MAEADVRRVLQRFGIQGDTKGEEMWALCPGHPDNNASWSINLRTGLHSCFSCGFQGNIAALVLEKLGGYDLAWGQREAWTWLDNQGLLVGQDAQALAVTLHLAGGRPRRGFQMPMGVVQAPLDQWPTPARRYAISRGLIPEQVQRWGLGYAVEGRLGGRIVFPFCSPRGELGGYSARSFAGHQERYMTPRKEERPVEGMVFGELRWPASWERDRLVVTEGAVDACSVERAVGGYVAGIPGVKRACNPRVLAKLATWKEIVLLTDPDESGEWAAGELQVFLARHSRVRRGVLPADRDATECTPEEIKAAVDGKS